MICLVHLGFEFRHGDLHVLYIMVLVLIELNQTFDAEALLLAAEAEEIHFLMLVLLADVVLTRWRTNRIGVSGI